MNKNKGIWLVIAAILVIGIAVTFTTSRFIRQRGGSLDTSAALQQMPGTAAGAPQPFTEAGAPDAPEAAAGNRSGASKAPRLAERKEITAAEPPEETQAAPSAASYGMEKAAPAAVAEGPESDTVKEEAAPAEAKESLAVTDSGPGNNEALVPSISPLGPAAEAAGASEEEKQVYYDKRLADIDVRVQKMRSESSDSTTYSIKMLAEKELKLWNIEMNTIYAEITQAVDSEEKEQLESSQQAWMKSRDTKAEEAARKHSGGSLEGVEYTASLAESTRQRVYDLVAEYIDVLPAVSEE